MSIREKLYLKIIDILNVVTGYFNTSLAKYYQKCNEAHADAFLKEFHAGDPSWVFSQQKKRKLNPNCKHLKGGRVRSLFARDHSLACHSFPDGTMKIWCLQGCGFESRPGDENWKDAAAMMEQSTNTPTASERTFPGVRKSGVTAVFADKE